ncbi:MAG TPA: 4Fe-4S dicluster domain-containing protein [Symbiobacteriaceae bacterium]|nr:4Fe-4S dicluster domain-containing protein [Symbiobacteriaceae bacterium]
MFNAKFRQITLAIRTKKATRLVPPPPAPGFRGLPALDAARCLGCGACAYACPSRLIALTAGPTAVVWEADFGRCLYCARCAEVCPSQAIVMTNRYETAVTDPAALRVRAELPLAACSRCGRPLGATRSMADYFPGAGMLCPTCKRRAQAAKLKGVARRG